MFKQVFSGKNEVKMINNPQVFISTKAYGKMSNIVRLSDKEIGWLGTATREGGFIYIDDVFLFEQEVNSVTCEITEEGLAKFAEELLKKEDGIEIWNKIKVWGHSHVDMSTGPSGQDDRQMEVFTDHNDWFIRIIANKKGELKIDLYDYTIGVSIHDINWEILIPEIVDTEEQIEKEIEEKVTEKKYGISASGYGSYYKSYSKSKENSISDKEEIEVIDFLEDDIYGDGYYNDYYGFLERGSITGDYYYRSEIEDIGSCKTFEDASEEIDIALGIGNSDKEKKKIWKECKILFEGGEE